MIIKTAEELRHYLPSHVFSNLDTMSGFLDNSENDFLAERIGKPLLASLRDCRFRHQPLHWLNLWLD